MKILFLTRYDTQGASSRMRMIQYFPFFESAGITCICKPLFNAAQLNHKYQYGNYSIWHIVSSYLKRISALRTMYQYDLVWIEKETLPWLPAWVEKIFLRNTKYIMDFDDAIFHNYDLNNNFFIRRFMGRKIDTLMKNSFVIIAGNSYLSNRAILAGAKRVYIVPTVIDLVKYTPKQAYETVVAPRIVWIGSPSSTQYLQNLSESLRILAKQHPFILRVIGGNSFSIQGVDIEFIPWTSDSEGRLIAECDIGIMPLFDNPWEKGKCSYKLIQYMASGLPTVASPIGMNIAVVKDGITGFFASSNSEWVEKLALLLENTPMRQKFGEAGHKIVEAEYCIQQTVTRFIEIFSEKDLRCAE